MSLPVPKIKPGALGFPTALPCWEPWGTTAVLHCPLGHAGPLDDHAVDDFGNVSPSVVCPREGCEFHAQVQLLDWPQPQ